MELDQYSSWPYMGAFGLAIVLLLVLRRLAVPLGLLDRPGGRKKHENTVPLVGGISMFLAFALSDWVGDQTLGQYSSFLVGSLVLVVIGALDDRHELSSAVRFLAQIASALIMALAGGVVLRDLGEVGFGGGLFELGLFAVPLTVFATVGVINALNMSDGIDGLAGLVTLVALGCLALVAYWEDSASQLPILGLMVSVVLAFLVFNLGFGRALVFMGDAGSMFLGFALAWFLIDFTQGEDRLMPPAVALWVVAVPLIDTVAMMLRRILKGRSPFSPDREHFHHVLLLAGFSPRLTLAIIVAVALLSAGFGIGGWYLGLPESLLLYTFLAFFCTYFFAIMRAWKVKRFLTRSLRMEGHQQEPRADNSSVVLVRLANRGDAGNDS